MTTPPSAPKRPFEITRHGDTRVDPYYWLMDGESEEVLNHLRAENDYLASQTADLQPLRDELFEEFKSHILETDMSVPVLHRGHWYFTRTKEGLNYPIHCRVVATSTTPPEIDPSVTLENEQVLLDENVEAGDSDFLSIGVLSLSPDEQWLAVGTDFDGDERHTVTVRPMKGQPAVSDELNDVYYGFAWANDSKHFFYTKVDDAMRPWQLWRHALGTTQANDVLIYQEDDPQYFVSVGMSRDEKVLLVQLGSSMTSEIRFLDANDATSPLQLLEERRHGIEYGVEHYTAKDGQQWWIKVTNEEALDFRALASPVESLSWKEIIPHRPGTRLDDVEAFESFLAIGERLDGSAVVRIVPLAEHDPFAGDLLASSRLINGSVQPSTVALSANPDYRLTQLRVTMTSLATPSKLVDIDVQSGEETVRKQQVVPGGFDEANYVTGRLWVSASDGVRIPVSVVANRAFVEVQADGSFKPKSPSPFLLYGYGSYEISIDPSFSPLRLSLLDRGVIFAIAHIRGGGEMGRSWYEMGKLAQKPTTFSDFVAVARWLIDEKWTSPSLLAAHGGSAGGLLMGAVVNLGPELFKAVIAEVPFVDSLTTMLNPDLPLTINEWEEWGNPDASATAYRTMKSYSPYDNVTSTNPDGTERVYPHIWAAGGLNDSRVGFWEPAKWVLKLRDANENNVVTLKTEMGAGHGGPTGRYDAWRDEAHLFAWLLKEILFS